ncbi:MAG: ATP-dependent Clp protease ATP-binding subunit [Candidatus Levybacteria bacterium]|nr:ATP-dependent Clp protease ATP-binding subunit [Candidatus Levybacteria bacterium]
MNIEKLIQTAQIQNGDSEILFFSTVALTILEESANFALLDSGETVKQNLQKLLDDKPKAARLTFAKKEREVTMRDHLEHHCTTQRQLLDCPTNDEHVILLSALKGLEELGVSHDYRVVLREILLKSLHKVDNVSSPISFLGRTKEIEEIQRVLQRTFRNSVLLVGETGVGKTTLAQSMRKYLNNTKVFQLFSGNSAFLDQVINILTTTSGQKSLLFMDELFTFESGQIKYAVENCQIIGTANESSYKKFAMENPGIISRFEVITIEEPIIDETKQILTFHQKRITETMRMSWEKDFLDELITLAKQYMPDASFPAKGINLLEESALFAQTQSLHTIPLEMLRVIISQKTSIPIGSLTDLDKKDLSELPNKLAKKVKGQDAVIARVTKVIQRSKLGFGKKNRPIGSFLFVGPSGVGKTELAKALAKEVFGDEDAMVRMDMSEYAEAHTVQRMLGAPPGYIGFEEGGQLTNPIKAKPYNLVLLDEIEKAHPRIFDIFLQVLDDGRLTDGQGKVVDFKNTIIIATSNAGIEDILDLINEGKTHTEIEKELKEILQDYFRIEFINRFDDIIIFDALKPEALEEIGVLQVEKLKQELAKRNIGFSVSEQTMKHLAKEGYDPRYGARGMIRLVQEKIENKLAEMIINEEIKEGERVEF